jgi:hypothetical protein
MEHAVLIHTLVFVMTSGKELIATHLYVPLAAFMELAVLIHTLVFVMTSG